ncbi:MAG TPA: hypothetical protein ENI73_07075 [Spirochaetes bacterium]|nr:hypothetical protein [Spirochaetota bacterium]
MEYIEYSRNWDNIFSMPVEALEKMDLEKMDEEDLDALSIRLKRLGEDHLVLTVHEAMLNSGKDNPAVEYMNLFVKVIIHWMGEKVYSKASDLLENYLIFDEKKRDGYRNHFIRRNLGICYIFMDQAERGQKIIDDLIAEAPGDLWTYHDIAIEYYFAESFSEAYDYLKMGRDEAKRSDNDTWFKIFEERMVFVEKKKS